VCTIKYSYIRGIYAAVEADTQLIVIAYIGYQKAHSADIGQTV
jgi:hypothetical protein